MKKRKLVGDAMLMAFVRVLNMCTGLLTTMMLSRMLPLEAYGTYSAGNLISNTTTNLAAFGLLDAVNFYYNSKKDKREDYVNTVFLLICLLSGAAAVIILVSQNYIVAYFHNPKLTLIMAYVALRPLVLNLEIGFRYLQMSIGKAKFVALRDSIISGGKLLIVFLATVFTANVDMIFKCIVLLEAATMVINFLILEKNRVNVRIGRSQIGHIPEILKFAIPMGIYIQANTLAQSLDAYVIGYFESTEKLAVYTNCATRLPIDFVALSFWMVLIPEITRSVQRENQSESVALFKGYLKIGYIFTWAFGTACIVLAPQAVQFLYSEKYLDGTIIFILYVLVDMMRFANMSLILSAKGRTKTLMWISLCMLLMNLVLNYLLYKLIGFEGPAVATVLVSLMSMLTLLKKSTDVLGCGITELFDWGQLFCYILSMFTVGGAVYGLRRVLEIRNIHFFVILVLCGLACVLGICGLQFREIRKTMKKLDA